MKTFGLSTGASPSPVHLLQLIQWVEMPFAKGVSAKSHVFDAAGNEANVDYMKLMKIVKDAGYTGYVGIEYEGSELSEPDGIMATKNLLENVGEALS